MRTNQQGNFIRGGYPSHSRLNTVTTAAVFIIVGLLFLGRNFGIIDSDLFGILVSLADVADCGRRCQFD